MTTDAENDSKFFSLNVPYILETKFLNNLSSINNDENKDFPTLNSLSTIQTFIKELETVPGNE